MARALKASISNDGPQPEIAYQPDPTCHHINDAQLALRLGPTVPRVAAGPILKWAGGKSQLLPKLQSLLPSRDRIRRYFEPFVGGAAMFFYLQPEDSCLTDTNEELINVYQVVRDHLGELIDTLRGYENKSAYFYKVRSQDLAKLSPVERAARIIYLNKTCYNGLYRVNAKGQFNVPFGSYKNPAICNADALEAASQALQHARIGVQDYEDVLINAGQGDFVYFDPPYHPLSTTSSFTSYTDKKFDANEQARLALAYRRLDRAGAYLMESNSDTTLIRALYYGFRFVEVKANRAINSKAQGRGPVTELVILNYSEDGMLLHG